jgi:hypothetical protein
MVGKVEEAVERLQEYRTALITAAVTGQDLTCGVVLPTTPSHANRPNFDELPRTIT